MQFTTAPDLHSDKDIVYDYIDGETSVELAESDTLPSRRGRRLTPLEIENRNLDNIKRYARFLATDSANCDKIIIGIIEGEARVLTAKLTIDEIFSNRLKFKEDVIYRINEELRQFGMRIMNANVKDLLDAQGSEYFLNRRKKILAETSNKALIDVAKAEYEGQTKSRDTDTQRAVKLAELNTTTESMIATQSAILRQKRAEADAAAVTAENNSKAAILKSTTDLNVETAAQLRMRTAAEITQKAENDLLRIQMDERNSLAEAKAQLERQRATELTDATVKAETRIKTSEAAKRAIEIDADAAAYRVLAEAKAKAEATKLLAAANLEAELKQAEAQLAARKAEAAGIELRVKAYGDPMYAALDRMIASNQLVDIAKASADAFKGLAPNISYWGVGDKGADGGALNPLTSIMASLPPMLQTIEKQTGMPLVSHLLGKTTNTQN